MSVFKDLVSQLLQEYDHVTKDVGRLLGENQELKETSEKQATDADVARKECAQLHEQMVLLTEELRVCRQMATPSTPALPGQWQSLDEPLRMHPMPPCVDVGVQAEAELIETEMSEIMLFSKHAFRKRSPGPSLGNPARRPSFTSGKCLFSKPVRNSVASLALSKPAGDTCSPQLSGTRFANLARKIEINKVAKINAAAGEASGGSRESFHAWMEKARERVATRHQTPARAECAEAPSKEAPVLAEEATHSTVPRQTGRLPGNSVRVEIFAIKDFARDRLPSQSSKTCSLVVSFGSQTHYVPWKPFVETSLDVPGQLAESPSLEVHWDEKDAGTILEFLQDATAKGVSIHVFPEGAPEHIGWCIVPVACKRQLWKLKGGGLLDCRCEVVLQAQAAEDKALLDDRSDVLDTPDNQERLQHLRRIFDIKDQADKRFLMAGDLLKVLKKGSKNVTYSKPLTEYSLRDAIAELNLVHSKIVGKYDAPENTSKICWQVFVRLMLISDLYDYVSPDRTWHHSYLPFSRAYCRQMH
eukprot:TRINITY_DN14270_c0_g1_i1.p1 TRINITY_DN14270_c0_g1~~TRINITY_DN14270_c0_g1_i1.p1  ORF type:complete len:529 (-),score=79.55 TRINITY_DN14270_c0_g1_i1:1573-3159(-)